MGRRVRGGLLSLILLLFACLPDPECVDHGDCQERQACRGGTCFDVGCTDGSHCPIEHRCTANYECRPGCDEDDDCLAGYACEDRSCVIAECESAELDCSIGELCAEGACERLDGLCATCEEDSDCAEGLTCYSLERFDDRCETDDDCADGYTCEAKPMHGTPPCDQAACPDDATCIEDLCHNLVCTMSLCTLSCTDEQADPCPGGFQCEGGDERGYCYAECSYLEEQGLYP